MKQICLLRKLHTDETQAVQELSFGVFLNSLCFLVLIGKKAKWPPLSDIVPYRLLRSHFLQKPSENCKNDKPETEQFVLFMFI